MKTTDGKTYWRSLDELQQTPEFQDFLHREFPTAASEFPEGMSRRRWMQLMGASLTLGGLAGCRWEPEKIAPLAVRPENRIPGKPTYFATSIEIGGMPRHLVATCYEGRPIKIEGNPDHPFSLGATDSFSQASILGLYDPDRSDTVWERSSGKLFRRSWSDFETELAGLLTKLRESQGQGFAILAEPTSSVTVRLLLSQIRTEFPKASVCMSPGLARTNAQEGSKLVYGKPLLPELRIAEASVVACFDADPLGVDGASIKNARDYASGRNPDAQMNRLYSLESQFTVTGMAADHRLPVKSQRVGLLLAHLNASVRQELEQTHDDLQLPELESSEEEFASALSKDLLENKSAGLVVVGESQPPAVHALAWELNSILGNVGKTVLLRQDDGDQLSSLSVDDLCDQLHEGSVDTLLVIGGNPAYDLPGELQFADALGNVNTSIRLGIYEDETSQLCHWHLPQSHPYESWGDVRSVDGTVTVSQPLIDPLLGGRSTIEILASFVSRSTNPEQLVREAISEAAGKSLSTTEWKILLRDGLLPDTEQPLASPANIEQSYRPDAIREVIELSKGELELVFTTSNSVLDGRFANNGWLQETPDPLTKMTWDNAALVSPQTAAELKLSQGSVIEIKNKQASVEIPVFVTPGQAKGSIGVALGYGRTSAGMVGGSVKDSIAPVGVNVNPLRPNKLHRFTNDFEVVRTSKTHAFATTQDHHAIDTVGLEETGRRVGQLVREGTVEEYEAHPDFAQHVTHHPPLKSLWEEPDYEGHAWGMSIDLNKCIGCNACMVACQAENNVPIVGKDQVAKGREMHWIRVDRYFEGDVENPSVATQPLACHHCENAPCEQVCPVAATVHSDEGLNDMIYNRCVGTRYCANNCPYKVRRFNFFDYNEQLEEANRELVQLVINPEVTVRTRGVMEKCTYCVQRIQNVKIDAKNEQRGIQDGELKTACQQACPTQAIEFGDLNNSGSRVASAHGDSRAYGMLSELNVKPRTKYLARIRNPNPALATSLQQDVHMEGSPHGHG